ncbi:MULTISPECIES: response regulator [Pseudoalteromonas]|uniref:Response regulator n=1 Tax=Pseudoalteromonas lipolytica TaxID=570156 RepID=A0AAD0RZ18_9GAMM|nr:MULTISPECIES: response regulator [Pseudoalteromonas]AXV64887.1 response regulator [Pseudoalteromonas donghaensis]EWH05892.1 chemotaxis protein CheY [Pseudoalteromonas lipolytica SCSIO 04301]MCC9660918.1 response regulator [Pseudoalteromonas sp. MB41]QLJ09392.1 response regulator [Pseudoalteromonas sp. JSTW]QPL43977.1 response regulator [Pseudoalteromonas sp. A41-2]|tara:strand:+ start:539 stop:2173 length:1635 start_codon:yes stop_codon:yes gene_type:complete
MPAKIFSKAKILIVEEQPLAQSYMKQSLEGLGFRQLRFADHAISAKEQCQDEQFDLIVCSFNLSKHQDGYQLYEELKVKRLIKNSTGFIFISAETSGSLVHSVLELQPDDFLVKPFTIYELKSRIEKVLLRKHHLYSVYQLIDDENDSKAIKKIDELLQNKSNTYSAILLRLKGDALLRLNRNEDAKTFFKSVLDIQKFTWAKVGLVEALIANNEHILAQRMLKTMLQRSETRLVALDLLGRLDIKLNKFDDAQLFFSQAVDIAPRNIERQKALSHVSLLNHDYEKSYLTQKDIASYAKHSIHDHPDIYLNAARAGIDFALTTDQTDQVNRIARQTNQYLNDLKQQFPNSNNQTQIDVLNARLHYLKDEHKKAKALIEQLDESDSQIRSVDGALDKAKAFHELGFHNKAQTLFNQIISHCERHPSVSDPVFLRYIQQQQTERRDIKMGPKELNNHAVTQFNKGQLNIALEAFTQAFRIMPKNASIALNLLQCLFDSNAQGQSFNLLLAKKCYALLNEYTLHDEQATRFEKIKAQAAKMNLQLSE